MSVVLPNTRVDFETFSQALPTASSALGTGVAFGFHEGVFSGVCPRTGLAEVQHDAEVQVEETRIRRTGSLKVLGSALAVAQQSVNLEVNHPFFHTIPDNQTGSLLFAGVMKNSNAG